MMPLEASRSLPPPDIYLVGTGIQGVWHLTREAEACLRASRHVFLVDHGYGVAQHIAGLGPTVHNLLGHYREGGNRVDTYRSMAAQVLDKALTEPSVSLAVYGHPCFFVYPSTLIRRAAAHLDLTVHVVAGVSSLDTLFVDLDLDPALNGLQIYDANALLVERRALDTEVPCLLLQVDAVESAYYTNARSRARRFERLQSHLLRFYPPDHSVSNVRSANFAIYEPEIVTFKLDKLAEEYATKNLGGTLYIPKAKHARPDEELVRQVFDPFHLGRISYQEERSQ